MLLKKKKKDFCSDSKVSCEEAGKMKSWEMKTSEAVVVTNA